MSQHSTTANEKTLSEFAAGFYQKSVAETVSQLQSNPATGLSSAEAARRLKLHGFNELEQQKQKSLWLLFLEQFASPLVWILIVAAILAFSFREVLEGSAIVAVILINACIGFFMEWQARNSMEALRNLTNIQTIVLRNGKKKQIASKQITIGDVLFLEAGDVVPADCRLFHEQNLGVNESALTGESIQIHKTTDAIFNKAPLAERKNILYKGTSVVRGNALAMVYGVGAGTELGNIARLTETASKEATPLEKKLNRLSRKLLWLTLVLAVLIFVIGWLQGRDLIMMIETSIALAIAAIPEGLPIVATIALARGMLRLAKHNVIVKKLSAVETLGETQVVFTDKTGTLTENEMNVDTLCFEYETAGIQLHDGQLKFQKDEDAYLSSTSGFRQMMNVAILCSNASLATSQEDNDLGDAVEIALLKMAKAAGYNIEQTRSKFSRLREIPFDSDTKMMGTLHRNAGQPGYLVCIKGALEVVLKECDYVITRAGEIPFNNPQQWLDKADQMAGKGLRLLALAYSEIDDEKEDFFEHLNLIGMVGFLDPPRADVKAAIDDCKAGGIKVVMITGDHLATAQNISFKTGLVSSEDEPAINGSELEQMDLTDMEQSEAVLKARVFARVNPAQKLELVSLYQSKGYTCGMTGDGINDTPALKKADIGIAMGQRGTEAAKEVADLILKDDAFPSIVVAVRQGRGIFENIRLFVIYLMSCNLSELLVVGIAFLANLPLPLQALQILFINMITDVFPALALGMNREADDIMQRPPRSKKAAILDDRHWKAIVTYALALTATTMGALLFASYYLGADAQKANNYSFYTLILAQLWHVFNLTSAKESFWKNEVTQNKYIWWALVLCSTIVILMYQIPVLRQVLNLVELTWLDAAYILGFSLLPVLFLQLLKRMRWVK